MHVHELNPWRTLIVVAVFAVVIIIGFLTLPRPLISYQLDMEQSIADLQQKDACFSPARLDSFLNGKLTNVVLFDIRDNFTFGQGHIPGAENMSANDLAQEDNIERLKALKEQNYTVVLYGEDQLQANGPWMLFRQAGFSNVKILPGGYRFYVENRDRLREAAAGDEYKSEIPRYDYAKLAAPENGAENSSVPDKKPVTVQRRAKSSVVAGGC